MNDNNDFREIIDEDDARRTEIDMNPQDEVEDKDDYEDVCYVCRRPESVAGKMIHIPGDICIC
ncbi:MAG: ATP-dependent Clp protease ATP-binding subunit ClpX, partial [Lachnospiraceae bacterium]|nr:ATP-dependent Clp protease ATP-binding subunit ClpX [Lachnospiraceae bacterium]